MNKLEVTAANDTSITFDIGGQEATLSADGVSHLIESLARYRTQMKPDIPATLTEGQNIFWTKDPTIALNPDHDDGVQVLFRHGGYGWIAFVFSEESAQSLQAMLASGTPH